MRLRTREGSEELHVGRGESLETVLKDPSGAFREFAISQYPRGSTMGYSIRTQRWRYTEWVSSKSGKTVARELYDHESTQRPTSSVAAASEHAGLISTLSQQLDAPGRLARVLEKDKDALANRKRSE